MGRERKNYRDNLESILAFTEGRHLLSARDVGKYLGRNERTVAKNYNIPKSGITAETLARALCSPE